MNEIMRRALADQMLPLVNMVRKLEAKLAGKPHFEWGTVTSVNPLRVKLDSHAKALPDRPDSLVTGLQEDDRVRIERQGTRVTVHGAGNAGDTGWTSVSFSAGYTGTARVRIVGNMCELRIDCTTVFQNNEIANPLLTLPPVFRPTGYLSLSGDYVGQPFSGDVAASGVVRLRNVSGAARSGVRVSKMWMLG